MGVIHSRLAGQLLEWSRAYAPERLSFFMTQKIVPHDRARNRIMRHFLGTGQATHLLMIDSDMVPPADALSRLLSHDKGFVTGITPSLADAGGTAHIVDFCFAPAAPGDPRLVPVARHSGLREIHRCTSGCMLLHRSVVETLDPPWFCFQFNDDGTEIAVSEDVAFCDRLRAAGITLYADTDVICRHEKSLLL
jgi:hypothetical protein